MRGGDQEMLTERIYVVENRDECRRWYNTRMAEKKWANYNLKFFLSHQCVVTNSCQLDLLWKEARKYMHNDFTIIILTPQASSVTIHRFCKGTAVLSASFRYKCHPMTYELLIHQLRHPLGSVSHCLWAGKWRMDLSRRRCHQRNIRTIA
jgi:hypothetical protein